MSEPTLTGIREQIHQELATTDALYQQLAHTLADVEALIAQQPPATGIPVHPGDDLTALIANGAAGATYLLDADYSCDHLTVTKPCTILGPTNNGMPIIRGSIDVQAPDVTLGRIAVRGTRRDETLVTAFDRTTIIDCDLEGSPEGQRRGVLTNCADVLIQGCRIVGIWHDQDAQAVGGWTRTANLTVKHCRLESSGENIMFGGADPADETGVPHDILIEDCELSKPIEWQELAGCTVKNLFELKNAKRVRMARCHLENCWRDGQDGWAIVLTIRNQEGTAPYSTIEDVVIEDCSIAHVGAGINILGRDDTFLSEVMQRVTIRRCTFDDLSPDVWPGAGRCVFIQGGPIDLTLEDLHFAGTGIIQAALTFDHPGELAERFVVDKVEWPEGWYGINGQDAPGLGAPVLDMYAPGYSWSNVTVHKQQNERWINWPLGTTIIDDTGGLR